jgi:pyridoxamine 5'-phosphate oxidase
VSALSEKALPKDPGVLFDRWYRSIRKAKKVVLPEAMCLSTISPSGKPEGRMVLLKRHGPDGFVFFTNLLSAKAASLKKTPFAALTFYWDPPAWQVRVEGKVAPVADAEADAYFATRPRGSQLAAWAYPQSAELKNRDELLRGMTLYRERFWKKPVPRPPFWSGYRVEPSRIEFWIARENRLHDRFEYRLSRAGWRIRRLAP